MSSIQISKRPHRPLNMLYRRPASSRDDGRFRAPPTVCAYDVRQLSHHPSNRPKPSLEPQVTRPYVNQSQASPRPRPKSSVLTPSQGVATGRHRVPASRQMARALSNNSLDRAASKGPHDQMTFDPSLGTLASQDPSTCASTPHLNRIGDCDKTASATRAERVERRRGRPKSSVSPRTSSNVPFVTVTKRTMSRPMTSNVMSHGRSLSNVKASSSYDISQSEADWSIIDAMLDEVGPNEYDADQEHQYIMDMALRSYKEHRDQELRQGRAGAWTQQPAGGTVVTSGPYIQQRTGAPASTATDGRAAATSGDAAVNRLLSKRPRAKSAFSSLRSHETVTKKELTLGRSSPVRIPQSQTTVAHAGPRPLGSTPSVIRADSPLGSELGLHMVPPPCPSPCSSRSASPSPAQEESGSVSDAISNVGRANLLHEDGDEEVCNDENNREDTKEHSHVPIPHDTPQAEYTQVKGIIDEVADRSPSRSVLPTPTVSIDMPMDKKKQPQRPKPAGGATAKDPGNSSSSTSSKGDGKKTSRDDSSRKYNFDGAFFSSIRSPKRQYFTIHPEWVSENLSVSRMTLREKTQTYPPRRCKSAPPPRSRNPITWEY